MLQEKSGDPHHSRRLGSLGALRNLELHLFSRAEGFKPIAEDSRIMNEHILTARLLNKSITFLRIKPFYNPLGQTVTLLFRNRLGYLRASPITY